MRRALLVVPLLALAACAVKPVYLNRDVRRVVVLPPFDESQTADLEASNTTWSHVMEVMGRRGYHVVSMGEVQGFYEQKKFTLPGEIDSFTKQQICEAFKADGVMYTHITYWGKKTLLVSTYVGCEMTFVLWDKNGEEIWSAKGENGKSSGGLSGVDIAKANADMLLTNPRKYAPGCVGNGLSRLPLAGFEPKGK